MNLLLNDDFHPDTEMRPDGLTCMTMETIVQAVQETSTALLHFIKEPRPSVIVNDTLAERYERILRGNIVWKE